MARAASPYRLAYLPDADRICAAGDPAILSNLLFFPGARDEGEFVSIPATRVGCMAAEAMAPVQSVGDEYREMRNRAMRVDVAPLYAMWPSLGITLARTLKLQQVEFCSMATPCRGAFNASEQGTGKTSTGWIMAHAWNASRALIVSPASLVDEWVGDYNLLFYEKPPIACVPLGCSLSVRSRATTLQSYADDPNSRVAAIINYESVDRMAPSIAAYRPDILILDESWRVKNPRAATSRALWQIADYCQHVLLLTGTAIGNDVGDLWAQLRMLNPRFQTPGRTPIQSHWDWLQRYARFISVNGTARGHQREILKPVGCADPSGLMQRIEPYWYRATKATCLDLPLKDIRPPVMLELPAAIKDLYREVQEVGEPALGASMSLVDARVIMLRLHQIAGGHLPQAREREPLATALDGLGEYLDLSALSIPSFSYEWELEEIEPWPKIEWVKQFANDRLSGDPSVRVLIWCRYNSEVFRLARVLKGILGDKRVQPCTGATKDRDLAAWKESFNSRNLDGVQVLVCQIKKMALGHNLQAGDYHIDYSQDWSYVMDSQKQDRSHRMGREAAVTYWRLVMRGTVDELIIQALARKQNLATILSPDTVSHSLSQQA